MTTPSETIIRGRYVRIDAIGYDNDPQHEAQITLVSQQDIKIPTGLLDLVTLTSANSLWQCEVTATCRPTTDGSLELLNISEADEDETPHRNDHIRPAPNQPAQPPLPRLLPSASQANRLIDSLTRQQAQGASPVTVADIRDVRSEATPSGYRHWSVTMHDDSVLEINPIPASDPTEPWLWAVIHAPDSGRVMLAQSEVCQAVCEVCRTHQSTPSD